MRQGPIEHRDELSGRTLSLACERSKRNCCPRLRSISAPSCSPRRAALARHWQGSGRGTPADVEGKMVNLSQADGQNGSGGAATLIICWP